MDIYIYKKEMEIAYRLLWFSWRMRESSSLLCVGVNKVIIDKYDPIAIYFIVWGLNLYTVFVIFKIDWWISSLQFHLEC